MKTEVLKSFSSLGCDAQLVAVTFMCSNQEVFDVRVRYLVPPQDWDSNYCVFTFGSDRPAANKLFRELIVDFI